MAESQTLFKRAETCLPYEEARSVLESVSLAHRDKGASKDQLTRAIDWARETRLRQTVLDLVLEGALVMSMEEDEPRFTPIEFFSAESHS